MAEFIKMPTLGFDMEEGTMGTWLKEIGEAINQGDVLAEIESDKVTQELTALASGTLLKRVGEPGDAIPVGALLGIIGADGEDVSGMEGQLHGGGGSAPAAAAAPVETKSEAAVVAPVAAPAAPVAPSGDALGNEFPGGVKATPVARRIASDKGVNLQQVNGTGPGGRIRKADVQAYVDSGGRVGAVAGVAAGAAAVGAVAATSQFVSGTAAVRDTVEVPATRLRQAIARRMTESVNTVPPFYVTMAIDMTDALALRKQINGSMPKDENGKPLEKVSVNDMIVKACGLALRQFPNLNASWDGDKVIQHGPINVGTAVAIDGGLLTVAQKNTDITPLREVAKQNRAMIGRARKGKVSGEDIQGSTFTTTNLGSYGVDNFIGIINPPEAAILAIGGANKTAVYQDGEFVLRDIMKVTISADHRVTDGAEAADFLVALKGILENPMSLLI